jgi:hypothetical protein
MLLFILAFLVSSVAFGFAAFCVLVSGTALMLIGSVLSIVLSGVPARRKVA